MQICHSLRCKQVDVSTAEQLISTFRCFFHCVYVFKQELQSIKRREISAVFHDEFVHVVQ